MRNAQARQRWFIRIHAFLEILKAASVFFAAELDPRPKS
jgi:hypothetical protein